MKTRSFEYLYVALGTILIFLIVSMLGYSTLSGEHSWLGILIAILFFIAGVAILSKKTF